jgi:hypothetical protein
MKFFRIITAVLFAGIAVLTSSAQAATTTQTFNVNLTLTPMCYINLAAGPANGTVTDVALSYTAFQATAAQASTSFVVKCTNTWPYDVAVSSDTGTVDGITYFVKLVAGASPSYASATGSGSVTGESGDGSTGKTYSVGVQAASGQPGTCATGPCTGSQSHTVTVTF